MKSLSILICLISFSCFGAMDKTVCATAVVATIKARNPSTDEAQIQPYWEDICGALIEHIQTQAQVTNSGTTTITSGSSAGTYPVASTGTVQ